MWWCVDCNNCASKFCLRNHTTRKTQEYYQKRASHLEERLSQCPKIWDQIIVNRRKVQNIYQSISESLAAIQSKLQERIQANDTEIERILLYQEQFVDSLVIPSYEDALKDFMSSLNALNQLSQRLNEWEDKTNQTTAHSELNSLLTIQEQYINVNFTKDPLQPLPTSRQIDLLKNLQLSFKATGCPPPANACISVLSFLILILAEDQFRKQNINLAGPVSSKEEPVINSVIKIEPEAVTEDFVSHEAHIEPEDKFKSSLLSVEDSSNSHFSDSWSKNKGLNILESNSNGLLNGSDQSTLNNSTINDDSVGRQWKCPTCGKAFKRRNNYNAHMATHSAPRSFICQICGQAFLRKSDCNRHLTVHSAVRPFKCDTCGQGFKRKEQVKSHARVHTQEKPYRCNNCHKSFSDSSAHKRHLKNCPLASFPPDWLPYST